MLKARFTLDSRTTPHAIDYVNLEGTNKGKRQAGIFELKGGTLSISWPRQASRDPESLPRSPGMDGPTRHGAGARSVLVQRTAVKRPAGPGPAVPTS
jgi:hypothetical protein